MKKIEKIINCVFIILFLLIILGGFLKPYLKPVSINYKENRSAYKIPRVSLNSFTNGNFQNSYELALSDQIPLSNVLKKFEKDLSLIAKLVYYNFSNSLYKDLGSVFMIEDYLVYSDYDINKHKLYLDKKAENINNIVNSNKNIKFYLFYVTKDIDINFENNLNNGAYDYLISKLNNSIKSSFLKVNDFNDYKTKFYKTDHHWNNFGSYDGYKNLVNLMTNDVPLYKGNESCINNSFSGSKIRSTGANFIKEDFCFYEIDIPSYECYINNEKRNYVDRSTYYNKKIKSTSYGGYYGADYGLIEFDFHQETKDNLLIIGNSYDNAINELIGSHFNKTYNVDLRYYEKDMGEKFNIKKFIEEKKISNVLIIGDLDYFLSYEFLL